jgi:AcrR family transcriptional regulator
VNEQSLDPRRIRTRERVFRAARTVLRRKGLDGTTFEAIATESGVARTTVYRNWTSWEELMIEAFDDVAAKPFFDDPQQTLADRLSDIVVGLCCELTDSEWGISLPSVVAAVDANPAFAARYLRLTEEGLQVARNVLDSAIQLRQLESDFPVDDFVDALIGPLYYRKLVRQLPTSNPWAIDHLKRTMRAFQVISNFSECGSV